MTVLVKTTEPMKNNRLCGLSTFLWFVDMNKYLNNKMTNSLKDAAKLPSIKTLNTKPFLLSAIIEENLSLIFYLCI